LRLVGLQVADDGPAQARQVGQGLGLVGRLLDLVLAKLAAAGLVGQAQPRLVDGLADREQADAGRVTSHALAGGGDAFLHGGEVVAEIFDGRGALGRGAGAVQGGGVLGIHAGMVRDAGWRGILRGWLWKTMSGGCGTRWRWRRAARARTTRSPSGLCWCRPPGRCSARAGTATAPSTTRPPTPRSSPCGRPVSGSAIIGSPAACCT